MAGQRACLGLRICYNPYCRMAVFAPLIPEQPAKVEQDQGVLLCGFHHSLDAITGNVPPVRILVNAGKLPRCETTINSLPQRSRKGHI